MYFILINISLNLSLESNLPAVFIIDFTQPITISLPQSTSLDIITSEDLHNPNYFMLRRQIARTIIAHYSGLPATTIEIVKSKTGSPEIHPQTSLYLSLSHRGSLAAIALSAFPIGVDLEIHNNNIKIPWNILHPFERTTIERADTQNRMDIFYQIWTGKEASVKALGKGFTIQPDDFCIFPNQASIRLTNKNIQISYKRLELSTDKTIHVSVAQVVPLLKLI